MGSPEQENHGQSVIVAELTIQLPPYSAFSIRNQQSFIQPLYTSGKNSSYHTETYQNILRYSKKDEGRIYSGQGQKDELYQPFGYFSIHHATIMSITMTGQEKQFSNRLYTSYPKVYIY